MKASTIRVNQSATHVGKPQERPVTLPASDAVLARELILYAAESMQAIIDWEVSSRRDRPIVQAMRAYVRDAKSLLERMR
jgi:hypothetical protein